jgi:nucleotide-binding universal stress UspA family protein
MKNLVALLDFSDVTFRVLKQVHAVATAFQSRVTILHVAGKQPVVVDVGLISPTILQEPSPELKREDEARLGEIRQSLAKFGVEAEVRQIEAGSADQLLEEAWRLQPDLLVVGSHRHGAWFQWLHGTVTAKAINHAPCPVLVVPADSNP